MIEKRLPRKLKKKVKSLYKKRYNTKWWLKCDNIFVYYRWLIKDKMDYVK